ncbi:sulfotransferase family protein (plasmid) [Cereibacter sphaeroides]|nr:sulfotransferase family protein [Cereibacter sphaeroides]
MTTAEPARPESPVKRHIFLVLGMHRSGTSALSGLLHHLGCRLPLHPMPASEANPRGHFESERLRRFNDRLLADCGSKWNDWRPLPAGWFRSPEGQARLGEARDLLLAEFDGTALAVLKDPRICRMTPFWQEAIAAAGFRAMPVLTFRNPLEVAQSLNRRDKIDSAEGLLIWLRHLLDAEAATRGAPRQITSYEQILANWAGVTAALQKTFDLSLPRFDADAARTIEDFLGPELRHHVEGAARVTDNPALLDWVRDTYRVLERWSMKSERKADHALLDRVRSEFDAAVPAFAALASLNDQRRRSLQDKVATLTETLQNHKVTAERLQVEMSVARQAWENAQAAQAGAEDRASAATAELAALHDRLSERESALAQRRHEADQATLRAEEAERARMAAETRNNELLAKSLKQMQEMGRLADLAGQTRQDLEELRQRHLEGEAMRRTLEARLQARDAADRALEAERARLEAEINALRSSTSWRLTAPLRTVVDRLRGNR